jgi:hypothetical protein
VLDALVDIDQRIEMGRPDIKANCPTWLEAVTSLIREKRRQLTFRRPFSVRGIDRPLPAGTYELVPDHELASEPYFPVYRPTVALLFIPPQSYRHSSIVKASVDSADILASHERDQAPTGQS